MRGRELTTILALRPGRRVMGAAVLEVRPVGLSAGTAGLAGARAGEELVFWGVSGFRERNVARLLDAVERRVVELVQMYQPDVVAIEEPAAARLRSLPALPGIVKRLRIVAKGAGLRFEAVRSAMVRERLCGAPAAPWRAVVERLVARWPHLGRYVDGASAGRREYWLPMFVAAGVGVVCDRMDGGQVGRGGVYPEYARWAPSQ